jgi:tRNA modification GTPase
MDTTISCLTPPGKAAIATLAVRGPLAWPITRQLFAPRKGSLPEAPPPGRCWFGKLGVEQADDVILAAKTDAVEIHCHGGVEVVRMIEELYVARGAVAVPWQAFVDDRLVEMLAQAPTARTAAIVLDQINGAWDAVEPAALARLEQLVPLGQHLVEPWRIVIAGAANVGKSSLLNAVAGYTRSIVSPTPGTTRDVVGVRLAIDGWPVELFDTAGIRAASNDLERSGIERAFDAVSEADLRLWLLDGSAEPAFPDQREGWHFVINKIDLPPAWDWQSAGSALRVSAQTRAGVPELCEWMSKQLLPNPPAPGEAVPCLPEQIAWVVERSGLPADPILDDGQSAHRNG